MSKQIVSFTRAFHAVIGHSAVLDGVTNHPNPEVVGPVVHTSRVEDIVRDDTGEIVRIVTRNSEYVVAAPQYDMNRCSC